MKKRFELDFLGQYYAGTIDEKQTGVFSFAVYLKESLNHKILERALNDLVRRYPFLCGCLRSNFFWYEYEITNDTLPLIPIETKSEVANSEQIFRVLYGEYHFVVEVSHLLCDGRTLSKITRLLLIRYFEILGIKPGAQDRITFTESQHPEEIENAYMRFANKAKKINKKQRAIPAYHPPITKTAPPQTLTYKLSAEKVKETAKAYEATVSAFLLALIFKSIVAERAIFNRKGAIIASIPVDCRSFFSSKTMRNFVSAQTIIMSETCDLLTMIKKIQQEFAKIDKLSVLEEFSSYQKAYQLARYLPRKLKNQYMKYIKKLESTRHTTGFSNVGKVDFPEIILNHIDFMEFYISLDETTPYYFSCVTVGNILTITITMKVDTKVLIEALDNNLNQFLFQGLGENDA